MTYEIEFTALSARGNKMGTGSFTVTTATPLDLSKHLSVERLCVEYARLTGIKCSFAQIIVAERDGE